MVTIANGFSGGLPVGGQQGRKVVLIGHGREAREHVAQVSERTFAMATARVDERVEDRRALARLGMPDEQPVFASEGTGADRILNAVSLIMPRWLERAG